MWKVVFCNTPFTKCLSLGGFQTSRSRPRTKQKTWPANTHNQRNTFVVPMENAIPNPRIIKKIQAWTPRPLVLRSPPGSMGGLSRCQSGRNKHAKWHVLWSDNIRAKIIVNDMLGHHRNLRSVCKNVKIQHPETSELDKSNFCKSWFLQYLLHQMFFPIPDTKIRVPNQNQ